MRDQVGMLVKFSRTPGSIRSRGPELGENTADLLGELGYDEPAISALESAGAIARSAPVA
jgi:formyl-CoA transferase